MLPAPAILSTLVMLWTGLLGWLDYGPGAGAWGLALNVAFNLISCAAFYATLVLGTRPLRWCVEHYSGLHRQRLAASATPVPLVDVAFTLHRQFLMARRYLWLSWHSFPIVWLLGAFGAVDGEQREARLLRLHLLAVPPPNASPIATCTGARFCSRLATCWPSSCQSRCTWHSSPCRSDEPGMLA